MDKIASPQDLASELRTLLASCQDGASREKLASDLRGLADRVAGDQAENLVRQLLTGLNDMQSYADNVKSILKDLDAGEEWASGQLKTSLKELRDLETDLKAALKVVGQLKRL